jgi:hypothetical protein
MLSNLSHFTDCLFAADFRPSIDDAYTASVSRQKITVVLWQNHVWFIAMEQPLPRSDSAAREREHNLPWKAQAMHAMSLTCSFQCNRNRLWLLYCLVEECRNKGPRFFMIQDLQWRGMNVEDHKWRCMHLTLLIPGPDAGSDFSKRSSVLLKHSLKATTGPNSVDANQLRFVM